MADDNVLEQLLRIRLDAAAAANAQKGIQVIKAGFVDLAATADKTNVSATTLVSKIAEINRANAIDKLGKDFGTLADKIDDADTAAKLLAGRLAEVGASEAEINRAATVFSASQGSQDGSDGGGSGIGLQGLRRTGSALTQLGLPGGNALTGLGDIGQITKEFQALAQVIPGVATVTAGLTPILGGTAAGFAGVGLALAPIAAIVLAVSLGIKALSDELDRSEKAFKAELDALQAETDAKNKNIADAKTRTSEQNRQQAQDDQERFNNQEDLLTKLKAKKAEIDKEYADLGSNLDPLKRKDLSNKGTDVDKAITDAEQGLIDLGGSIENTVKVLGPEIDQREAEALAMKKEDDAIKARQQSIEESGKVEIEARTLAKTATEKQVQALLDSISVQRDALAQQAKDSQALFDETAEKAKNGDKAAAAALGEIGNTTKSYTDQIVILDARTKALTETTLIAAKANDAAIQAKKNADDEVKINDKLNSDLAAEDQKAADTRKSINSKLADDLVNIAQKSADNAQAILDNLVKQEDDAALKLSRADATAKEKADFDALQKQIDFQRTEAAATQKHLNDLKRIRDQANETEFEEGLDRDFAGISKTKRTAAQQINAANEQFDEERAARLQAYKDKQDDDQRQFIFEHQQRVEAEQQAIADAKKAADAALRQNIIDTNKAKQAAREAATKAYNDLQESLTAERNLKIAAAQADLQLVVQTEQAKQAAYAASLAQAEAVLNGATQAVSSGQKVVDGHVVGRAGGGALAAGQVANVNESGSSGNEGFTAGGKSIRFPGSGIFVPFKSGTVDKNAGGTNVQLSITNNITAGGVKDAQKIADVVDKRIEQTITRIFQVKAVS